MISLRRIFGLMLLFFFFEAVVAVVTTLAYPNVNVFLACVAMTGLAVGVWAVFMLVTRLMTRTRTPAPPPPPRAAVPAMPRPSFGDDSFSQELGSLVAEADRRLAGALPVNARGETPTVATLPLYLVIGGEGAGKTSAIVNSGLEPRLLAGEASREGTIVPTRLCNLWYAEGAVFADLSGRVLMQEPENWERALRVFSQPFRIPRWKQMLLGRRSHLNLKGLVLVSDIGQFVRANEPQRIAAFARTLSDRLQTAGAVFRREFPVYVVFGKCDGVHYFGEFFAHLSEPEGRRLLGATLPMIRLRNDTADIYANHAGKRLTEHFNRLYMALAEKRLVFLAREDDAAKKSNAYEFPRELKKLRGEVVQFLLDVFRPNPLHPGPRLRGFYLAGQRWVARNLEPAAEGTVAGFTVAPKRADATIFFGSKPEAQPAPGGLRPAGVAGAIPKWMFLADLFHNVVLKDRAGNVTPRTSAREQEYRNFVLAGAGGLLLVLCLLWANAWRNNRDLLNTVQTAVDSVHTYQSQANADAESVADLDSLRGPLVTLLGYERRGAPLSYRWGLYSGHEMTTALDSLYFDRFRKIFLDPLLTSMTSRFLGLEPTDPGKDDVYSLLKSYRMITSGACKVDAEFLTSSLLPVWLSGIPLAPLETSAVSDRQMQFFVSELSIQNPYEHSLAENGKAVAQAQLYLRELHGPDKILRALVEQLNHDKQGDMLSSYAPNYGAVLTGPNNVDAAYTRAGWDAMMESIRTHKLASAGETCVVGTQSAIKDLAVDAETEREVQDLYVKDYIQRWKSFLAAHHVEPFGSASDAAERLSILADNNRSPLLGLVYMAAHNTDLASAQSGDSAVTKAIEQTKESVSKRIKDVLGNSSKDAGSSISALKSSPAPSGKDVVREFGPVRAVVDPANSEKWLNSANQPYVQALAELGNSLGAMPARIDPKEPMHQQARDRAIKALEAAKAADHALGSTIPNTTSGVDVNLKALLLEPITHAEKVIRMVPLAPPPPDLTIPIRAQVNKSANSLCASAEAMRSKYPFNAAATQEVTIQDLNGMFAPGAGAYARFSQLPEVSKTYLRQGKAWVPNPSFPGDFSQPFLQELNGWSDFSEALYADGSGNPHFDYTLTLDGTGNVPFELEIDGHVLHYKPKKGPVVARLVWPPTTNAPTRLNLKAGMQLPFQSSGLWSVFHLLQAADRQEGNVFVYSTVQFAGGNKVPLQDGKGNPVTIQLRIDSTASPVFGRGYFGKLRCDNFAGWAVR
jgi:type VI secretion system protein ImpL